MADHKKFFKDIIKLLRDTFIGEIHVDYAIREFNHLIEEVDSIEDFDHENRIYTLEGEMDKLKCQPNISDNNT